MCFERNFGAVLGETVNTVLLRGGDVAQLVEHRTGTPPTQVRFPGAARDFPPRVNFSADCHTVFVHPRVQSHAFTYVRTLKILSPGQSLVDYGNTKTPSMHSRLGSATLSQLAFPRESNLNFPWEKSHLDNTVVKKKKR